MCDPLSLIMGGLSAASSVASAVTQQNAQKKQEQANNQWMQFQRQQRLAENARQEDMRQKAELARQDTVQDLSPEAQQKAQAEEQSRLEGELGAKDSSTAADKAAGNQADVNAALLSGQSAGGQMFMQDMASRVSKATADARGRLKALAGVQSFGGTMGGLQTRNALELQQGEQGINLQNNFRQGSLGAYGAMQAVDPIQYNPTSNPWGGIANALAGIAGQRGGSTMGSGFFKA